MRRYVCTMRCEAGDSINYLVPDRVIRPTHITVDVNERGIATIKRLIVANCNVLITPVDGYEYCLKLMNELRTKFYEEHKLADKNQYEIDRYLDENGVSPPEPNRIDIPTVTPQNRIQVHGTFKVPTSIAFTCWTP